MRSLQAPNAAALDATRSWVVLTIVSLSWLLTMVVVLPKWPALSDYERGCTIIALPLILAAIVFARSRWTLVLPVIAMACLGLTALVPSGGAVWTYPQTYFGYVGFILSMLLPRRIGLITAIAIPLGVWAIWLSGPVNVVPESFSVANGSIQLLRMLGGQLVLWWAWHSLVAQAQSRDERFAVLREAEFEAIADQERSARWRESARRVHATMLNSIHALLDATSVDPAELRALAAEGRAAIDRTDARDLPLPEVTTPEVIVNAGIVLLSSALGGALIGGSLYVLFIDFPNWWIEVLTVALSMLGCAFGVLLVLTRRRIRWPIGLLLVLPPALVPSLLGTVALPCDSVGAVSAAASIAGFSIVCIGLWSGVIPFTAGLLVWVAGAVPISQATALECRIAPTVIVLNVATFLPLAIALTIVGQWYSRRSQRSMDAAATAARLQRLQAIAAADVDADFRATVHDAAAVLDEVAMSGTMTPDARADLAGLRSRLRLSVQIDVGAAHGLARAAYDLVTRLTDAGVRLDVGVVSVSSDQRPVAPELLDRMEAIGRLAGSTTIRIQCVSARNWDFLSMNVPLEACVAAGLPVGTVIEVDDTTLSVHDADEELLGSVGAPAVVILEREAADHPVVEPLDQSGGGSALDRFRRPLLRG